MAHSKAWYIVFEGYISLRENSTLSKGGIHWFDSEREAVEALAALYKKYKVK